MRMHGIVGASADVLCYSYAKAKQVPTTVKAESCSCRFGLICLGSHVKCISRNGHPRCRVWVVVGLPIDMLSLHTLARAAPAIMRHMA